MEIRMSTKFVLSSGKSVVVDVAEDEEGNVTIMHTDADTETVHCTCQSTGKSVSKDCPKGSSPKCDCIDPHNPRIIC